MKTEIYYVARPGWIANTLYAESEVGARVALTEAQAESYLLAGQLTREAPKAAPKKKD
jgi:hypothetical protein